MKITKVHIPPTTIYGPADLSSLPPRSAGLHLSQIYGSLENDLDQMQRSKKNGISLDMLETYRTGGFIWEQVFSTAMANGLAHDDWQRPGEFSLDGIAGSPDLIGVHDWVLGETKFTWKSSRRLEEFEETNSGPLWVWGVQIKSYCHMIGTNRARLFAYFVNGDYKTKQPQFEVRDLEFTSAELRENWSMLKNHARSKGWL